MRSFISAILFLSSFFTIEGTQGKELHRNSSGPSFSDCSNFEFLTNKIKEDSLLAIFLAISESSKMAQDLVGLADCYFYSISLINKEQSAIVYNQDIALQINSIKKNIKSLTNSAKQSARFITKTLSSMNEAINILIIDSSLDASQNVINADYAQIELIIDAFKKGFPQTLNPKIKSKYVAQAVKKAEKSLQDFANNIEIYISELNELVFHSSEGNKELLSSNHLLILSLKQFVEASAVATYFGTKEIKHCEHAK